jgi:hypothetical protein
MTNRLSALVLAVALSGALQAMELTPQQLLECAKVTTGVAQGQVVKLPLTIDGKSQQAAVSPSAEGASIVVAGVSVNLIVVRDASGAILGISAAQNGQPAKNYVLASNGNLVTTETLPQPPQQQALGGGANLGGLNLANATGPGVNANRSVAQTQSTQTQQISSGAASPSAQ